MRLIHLKKVTSHNTSDTSAAAYITLKYLENMPPDSFGYCPSALLNHYDFKVRYQFLSLISFDFTSAESGQHDGV